MQNQYFVKGLGFSQKQEILETRSYNRIRKLPYSNYNNRSYNINYRDVRQVNDKLKRIMAVLNKAIKNQAQTMFKYLSIYVQNKQEQEIKAQLKVVQEGLLRFQHAISIYNQRQKCIAYFRLAKLDVMSHLKKQFGYQRSSLSQPITHEVFRKWQHLTFASKCTRLLRQQQHNMIKFYKFVLRRIDRALILQKRKALHEIRTTKYKFKMQTMIENIGCMMIRLKLYQPKQACAQFNKNYNKLDLIIGFHRIKEYKYFHPQHHHLFNTLHNIINSKFSNLKVHAYKKLELNYLTFQNPKTIRIPKQLIQNIEIEVSSALALSKLEHQKQKSRTLKLIPNEKDILYLTSCISTKLIKLQGQVFYLLKNYHPQQDEQVQSDIIKNMSIVSAKMSEKIKEKNRKSNQFDRIIKIKMIFINQIHYQRRILKQYFVRWQDNISFAPQIYEDFEMRIQIMQNEKDVLINDIEQLETLNNELFTSVDQAKRTFFSDSSNKQDLKQINNAEIHNFEIQEQFISQEDLKIGFEYINFLKELNISQKQRFHQNELQIRDMEAQLQKLSELEQK